MVDELQAAARHSRDASDAHAGQLNEAVESLQQVRNARCSAMMCLSVRGTGFETEMTRGVGGR